MSHSRFHGWKSRLYHRSQSPAVLIKITAGLLLAGFLLACAIVALQGRNPNTQEPLASAKNAFQTRLDNIASSDKNHARLLAAWLHDVTSRWLPVSPHSKRPAPPVTDGGRLGFDLEAIVRQHVTEPAAQALFDDYVAARTRGEGPFAQGARKRLENAAATAPATPFANEFVGDLLQDEGKRVEAMEAFRNEGAFPDARNARRKAFAIAVDRQDLTALREMLAMPDYLSGDAGDLHRAGMLLGDWGLMAKSFIRLRLHEWRPADVTFTLLAGMLWYAVFVRMGVRDRWRWFRPIPAVIAGVVSIWPVLILIHWQELHLGQEENGEFLHDLIFFVTGVGLREEAAKLALFAVFLPGLLKQRSAGAALLTGAFVGLGFALDENLQYFRSSGIANAAPARFLTANFFHAAATGLTAHALYELARTKFGSAERFIATFVAVVVVHGVYDWVMEAGSSLAFVGNISMFSIIILALLAGQFFDQVYELNQPKRGTVSLLGVFLPGLALLVASGFVIAAIQAGTLTAISRVGMEAISLVPITVFYVRKFGHL